MSFLIFEHVLTSLCKLSRNFELYFFALNVFGYFIMLHNAILLWVALAPVTVLLMT
jgi:hypothetical protein